MKLQELVNDLLKQKNLDRNIVHILKQKWAKKYRTKLPLSAEIFNSATPEQREKLKKVLVTKPNRTMSGVSVVAIMAKPAVCPGKCIYCPKGENSPKSYTGYEPASMRAKLNKYDAFKQVQNRLAQLQAVGHNTDKNELIIMGGTFPSLSWNYQKNFVKNAFDGFNSKRSMLLSTSQKINEKAKNRVIGLTIETRPDYVYVGKLLTLGATRVEIGVQTIYDNILKKINRGHSTEETIEATKILKNAGFKILYHIMPGLPGSNFESDLQVFKKIFSDEKYKPDMLKIYPTLVIKGTPLYEMWKAGKYKPIDEQCMEKLLKEVLRIAPKWVRIMRVQRDIPCKFIEAGPKKSNIREIVEKEIESSNEIRFREVGRVYNRTHKRPKDVDIDIEKYEASDGTEYFISAEDKKQNILLGFARLRIAERKEALLRELHVYGSEAAIGEEGEIQHKGWGKKLMNEAERLAIESGKNEMLVISGVGAREYYKKLGYQLKRNYMHKQF